MNKLICWATRHKWSFLGWYMNFKIPHRRCKRCDRLQRHAGLNYWVTLEKG